MLYTYQNVVSYCNRGGLSTTSLINTACNLKKQDTNNFEIFKKKTHTRLTNAICNQSITSQINVLIIY